MTSSSLNLSSMELSSDVLIIGTGIAGLATAIELSKNSNSRVLIVTRESQPEKTNTFWAQGGIIIPVEGDQSLASDIQKASSHTSCPRAVDFLITQSQTAISESLLKEIRPTFDRNPDGSLSLIKEAVHTHARIAHRGDFTGKELQIALLNYLKELSNVEFLTSHTALDLITPSHHGIELHQRYEPHQVVGAYVFDQKQDVVKKIMAKSTVLATGGMAGLYLHNTNSEGARGDGLAMAARAGARIINMEFVQFHPTTFYTSNVSQRRFLISEAIRGEGGVLVNHKGERFMERYHKDLDLAPRDVVSRSIHQEMISQALDHVYLDLSHRPSQWIQQRFPTIYKHCLANKIDITSQPIPVVPSAHYSCGGIKVNTHGQTSVKGLYAVGEVSCTGLHGANRLASTSLLEGFIWGQSAAHKIISELTNQETWQYPPQGIKNWKPSDKPVDLALIAQDWHILRQTMWNYVGLIRSRNRLLRAKSLFIELAEEIQKFYRYAQLHDQLIGLRNGVEVAQMVLNASTRAEQGSIGCFYRQD